MAGPLLNRRSLLKAAASAAAGVGVSGDLCAAVQRAFGIDPEPGSTFLDAEHVVFLMQENRSFDHCFGSLQGVRGFNDPRAIALPGGRPVWLQANRQGEVFAPFRLDIRNSNATWIDGLPHSWPDQVDARNHGRHDQWLAVKIPVGGRHLAQLPLAMGYHTRADLPFHYALADAFTICDQHFCSSLTGTTPNRLHAWTGTIRPAQTPESVPLLYNDDTDHIGGLDWTTFPERLTDAGISWRVYQNELTVDSGLGREEQEWLGNFGDNPLEYFARYRAWFAESRYAHLQRLAQQLPGEIAQAAALAAAAPGDQRPAEALRQSRQRLEQVAKDLAAWHPDRFAALPAVERALHQQAFTTNRAQADYRRLGDFAAPDAYGNTQSFPIPAGDILHGFRADVANGRLPTVSWLVAPRNFSDHPCAPWFGAWYASEVLDILTRDPAVWKKTIFVLSYDENDGFFDHCPPFVAPRAGHAETGGCSAGVDATLERTTRDRTSPIGLGFRVPMIVASPWSRGGWVDSQVFDHTSSLRFLEGFLNRKFAAGLRESNLSSWRRAVVGDLTSAFRPWQGQATADPAALDRRAWLTAINAARGKPLPDPGPPLTAEEIAAIGRDPGASARMPRQEPGTRPACALPYELAVDGTLDDGRQRLVITFAAGRRIFGATAAGSPFQVHAPGRVAAAAQPASGGKRWEEVRTWDYAVAAGESLRAEWPLADFAGDAYHLRVYGPNGFYRELRGSAHDPALTVGVETAVSASGDASGELLVSLRNPAAAAACVVAIQPHGYAHPATTRALAPGSSAVVTMALQASSGWYDFTVSAAGDTGFSRRYAGRVETGRPSRTDPAMGG